VRSYLKKKKGWQSGLSSLNALPSKCEALSSNPNVAKKKKKSDCKEIILVFLGKHTFETDKKLYKQHVTQVSFFLLASIYS
jgi:hypothetical protein